MSAQPHSAPLHANIPDLNAEVMRLRHHIAWLHGTLSRLGDMRPVASDFDLPMELTGRLDYARRALAASLRRCAEFGVHDRPPSLAALVVGQALAQPPEERDARLQHAAPPCRRSWGVAWCNIDGRISVTHQPPVQEVCLATGDALVLWHWVEELAVRGTGADAGHWLVPGITADADLDARFQAALAFSRKLTEAGRTIWPITPDAGSFGRAAA